VGWSLASKNDSDFKSSAFRSLGGIVRVQKLEVEDGKKTIASESKTGGIILTLFNAIAAYWVNGRLSKEMIERIDPIFQSARDAGMGWVAMESAALLIRSGKDNPERREFLDEVMKRSGMQPIVSSILVEEPWQKGLRALIRIGSEPDESPNQKSAAGTRLIWLVGYFITAR
jgi:hypothetical protein